MKENVNYETIKNEVLKALEEADTLFDKMNCKETFILKILSGVLQKETEIPIMNYYTCKLLSDL